MSIGAKLFERSVRIFFNHLVKSRQVKSVDPVLSICSWRNRLSPLCTMSGHDDNSDAVMLETSEVLIELNDDLKSKLAADFSSICEVDNASARQMLEKHKWNMQNAIDEFLDGAAEDEQDVLECEDVTTQKEVPDQAKPSRASTSTSTSSETSTWAPEKFSVLSWNLDGLDEKNLEKRTAAVVDLIEKENFSVVFLQELLPSTFHYIATRLESKYIPVLGTDNPNCDYLVATFLRLNHIVYEDHSIIPFPGSCMGRNVLVTKAYTGRAKLMLLNTHLESTKDFATERIVQLKKCFDLCKSSSPEWNVIFGGDLNLRDKEVCGLIPDNMYDLWIKCGSRSSSQYTWDLTRNTNKQMPSRFQPRMRFDRLYYRESVPATIIPEFFGVTGLEKVTGTQSFPSDHWGIISFFRLDFDARKPQPKKRKGGPIPDADYV